MEPDAFQLLGLDRFMPISNAMALAAIERVRSGEDPSLPEEEQERAAWIAAMEQAYSQVATKEARAAYSATLPPDPSGRTMLSPLPDVDWDEDPEALRIVSQPDFPERLAKAALAVPRPVAPDTELRQGSLEARMIDPNDSVYRLHASEQERARDTAPASKRTLADAETRESLSLTLQAMLRDPYQLWSLRSIEQLLKDVPRLGREKHVAARPIDHTHAGLEILEFTMNHQIRLALCDRYGLRGPASPSEKHTVQEPKRLPELTDKRGRFWFLKEPVMLGEDARRMLGLVLVNGTSVDEVWAMKDSPWESPTKDFPPPRTAERFTHSRRYRDEGEDNRVEEPYLDTRRISTKTRMMLNEELLATYAGMQITRWYADEKTFRHIVDANGQLNGANFPVPCTPQIEKRLNRLVRDSERQYGNMPHMLLFPRVLLKRVDVMPLPQQVLDWGAFRLFAPRPEVVRQDRLELTPPQEEASTDHPPRPVYTVAGVPVFPESRFAGRHANTAALERFKYDVSAEEGYFSYNDSQRRALGVTGPIVPPPARQTADPDVHLAAFAVRYAVAQLIPPEYKRPPVAWPPPDRSTEIAAYVRSMAGRLLRSPTELSPLRQAQVLVHPALQMTYYSRDPEVTHEAVLGAMLLAKAHFRQVAGEPYHIDEELDFTGYNSDKSVRPPVEHKYMLAPHDPKGLPYKATHRYFFPFEVDGILRDISSPSVRSWRIDSTPTSLADKWVTKITNREPDPGKKKR